MLSVILAACAAPPPAEPDPARMQAGTHWEAEALAWRAGREERLTAPYSWLSIVALEFPPEGVSRIGSGADNDIVLPAGPESWGELHLDSDTAVFLTEPGVEVRADGELADRVELRTSGPGMEPTRIEADTVQWHLIRRGDRVGVRVRDTQADTRLKFAGLDYFPLAREWRVEADFEEHPPGRTITVVNVLGDLIEAPNPGAAVFLIGDTVYRLEAIAAEDPEQLFFILADRTSGRETYGLGRFLYADRPRGGKLILDFNRAYNPPCAFNEFTTCQLPPPENRLDLAVTAGELAYRGLLD